MAFLGDGSVLPASLNAAAKAESGGDNGAQTSVVGVRAVERLVLRTGWLVARDCQGLILRRHVADDVAVQTRQRLNEIVLD